METPPIFGLIPMPGDPDDIPAPDNGPYFVAAKSGYYLVDKNHFGKYLVPIKEIESLNDTKEVMWYDIPKMPDWVIGQAWSFFRAIYNKMKSEAMLDITWSEAKGYRLFIAPQQASGGGVKCERTPEHYKGQIVGTIHSHCNFSAFHSSTDKHDGDMHDGLHITIGNVLNTDKPSIAIMITKNGKSWPFNVEHVQESDKIIMYDHPEWWMPYVREPDKTNTPTNHGQSQYKQWNKQQQHTGLALVGAKPDPKIKKDAIERNFALMGELLDSKSGQTLDPDTAGILLDVENNMAAIEEVLKRYGIDIDYSYNLAVGGTSLSIRENPIDYNDDLPFDWRFHGL